MPIEAYFPAKPGDPILAETWNSLQTTIRAAIDDLGARLAGKLSVTGIDTSGAVRLTGSGVIQRGGAPIAATADLGLYSTARDNWIRLVTNQAPIKFFSDGDTSPGGSTVNFGIEASGDATLRGRLTAGNGLTVNTGGASINNGLTVANGLTVTTGATSVQALNVAGGVKLSGAGVVQRGGAAPITGATDLGLYAADGNPIRLVTNNAAVQFYGDYKDSAQGGTTVNLTLAATGDATLRGRFTAGNGLTVNTGGASINSGLTVSGGCTVTTGVLLGDSGVVQRGGTAPISDTKDLGLYSTVRDSWIRLVSNQAPIKFFSDGGTTPSGSFVTLGIEANGDASLRGRFTAGNGLTVTSGSASINAGLTVASGLTVTSGSTSVQALTVGGGLTVSSGDTTVQTLNVTSKLLLGGTAVGGVPVGVIVMWSGTTPPAGWYLCDGSNGTPDLRDRFIVGSGNAYSVGATGGAATVTLGTTHMPRHSHPLSESGGHQHNVWFDCDSGGGGPRYDMFTQKVSTCTADKTVPTTWDGPHTHPMGEVGDGQAHENRPPYYALAFIMYRPK